MDLVPSKKLLKILILYFFLAFAHVFLDIIYLISYPVRCLVTLITSYDPEYGKLLGPTDSSFDEDFLGSPPKSTIITTVTLEGGGGGGGAFTLEEFSRIFRKHVLDARLPLSSSEKSGEHQRKKYPEFQQFIANYWGFRVWKNEMDFRLEEHIQEKYIDHLDLSEIHENLINRPFKKWRSPWEIYLFRTNEDDLKGKDLKVTSTTHSSNCVIALKTHHTMGDVQSILRCLVECLRQKQKIRVRPPTKAEEVSFLNKVLFCIKLPLNYVFFIMNLFWNAIKSDTHPWKTMMSDEHEDPTSDGVPLVVRLSPKLSFTKLKQVADKNQVLVDSVILSIIGGAIGKYDLRGDEIFVGYHHKQDKDKRSPGLSNHFKNGCLIIPTTSSSGHLEILSRLKQCNDNLLEMNKRQWDKSQEIMFYLLGSLFNSWRNIIGVNYYWPVLIRNVTMEPEDSLFGNSKVKCSDINVSIGPSVGTAGVGFTVFSYRDSIQVAVVAKETVLSDMRADQIAKEIEKEFNLLHDNMIN